MSWKNQLRSDSLPWLLIFQPMGLKTEGWRNLQPSTYFVSNIERDNPDCLIIPNKVPVLNSSCSGTGTVIVEPPTFFCMMIWLPFCLTFSNPCSERILQTSLPESTRSFGILCSYMRFHL